MAMGKRGERQTPGRYNKIERFNGSATATSQPKLARDWEQVWAATRRPQASSLQSFRW